MKVLNIWYTYILFSDWNYKMAMSVEISDNLEITKNHLLNSELSDEDKNVGLKLLNISALATNGISMEEKIQKMSESVFCLLSWQIRFIAKTNELVDKRMNELKESHCHDCIAYKHAVEVEKEKKQKEVVNAYLKTMGVDSIDQLRTNHATNKQTEKDDEPKTMIDVLKMIFLKPYVYIFLGFAVFSPFAVEIVKLLMGK